MASPLLLTLRDAEVTFGGSPVFSNISLNVGVGDKACLVGRNGCGKSTLLKVLADEIALDHGDRFVQPNTRAIYLPQDPRLEGGVSVRDYASLDLGHEADLHRVDTVLDALKIDGDRDIGTLSGGEGRRAALARALAAEPDLLLMDEPTNHLDLPAIQWLEDELANFAGTLIMVSHDRTFLRKLTNRIFWMNRGEMRQRDEGFAAFEKWSEEVQAEEEAEMNRLNVQLKEENHWLQRGVTARRKRNMGRMRKLYDIRQKRAEMAAALKDRSAKLAAESGEASGKVVIEAKDVKKAYGGTPIINGFSCKILRGDRVGILGPNGAGKTTLLKLLTGKMEADEGEVRLGSNLTPAYFDQHRAALNPEDTLWEAMCETGGDYVDVRGRQQHVVGYLRDFLFEERQARAPVSTLSGGERNRLLLAKLLAKPSNLLILDEPTNDLDMETLDLLQEVLDDYDGTLLVVSHDRDFLDRLVTSTIAVEGKGDVREYVGGYEDYLRQRKQNEATQPTKKKEKAVKPKNDRKAGKLGYKDQRELDSLPRKMDDLRARIEKLEEKMHDADFYSRDPDGFQKTSDTLEAAQSELEAAEERWLELEMLQEELSATS